MTPRSDTVTDYRMPYFRWRGHRWYGVPRKYARRIMGYPSRWWRKP